MSVSKLARVSVAVAMAAACFSAHAEAHDPRGIGSGLPTDHLRRIAEHMKSLESLDDSDAARGMYSTMVVRAPTYPRRAIAFINAKETE